MSACCIVWGTVHKDGSMLSLKLYKDTAHALYGNCGMCGSSKPICVSVQTNQSNTVLYMSCLGCLNRTVSYLCGSCDSTLDLDMHCITCGVRYWCDDACKTIHT